MKGWSRELLLRTLGEFESNRVYPQQKGVKISELSDQVTNQITHIIFDLIEEKGWTTEIEILDNLILKFKGQNQFKKKQFKRIFPELMDKYALSRVRLNNSLKHKFQINKSGYFNIIILDY